MRLLADAHISARTVQFLRSQGHDVIPVSERLPPNATDGKILASARQHNRVILTQDLDFSELLALSGASRPSVISLRLSSSKIELVNSVPAKVLPQIASDVEKGAIVSVGDRTARVRLLPI